jgi:hypothetical protein
MKRLLLFVALALILSLAGPALVESASAELVGAALIGHPVSKKTIPSTSDVGFAVTAAGGMFVCSMAGPVTGGFKGLKVMTVEGPVTRGSFKVSGNTASFSGRATVVLVPGMNKAAVQLINDVPFTASVGVGGPGKGWLILKVPAFTKTLGGNTGGVIRVGRFSLRR